MKKEEFAARVAELHEQAAQAAVLSAQEVIEELTRLGRANMADYIQVGPNGDPILDLRGLNRSEGAALVEVTVKDFKDGRGADARDVRRVRFKLADKRGALNLLGKHHALFTERHVHEVSNIGARLTAALARLNQQGDDEDRHASRGGDARRPREDQESRPMMPLTFDNLRLSAPTVSAAFEQTMMDGTARYQMTAFGESCGRSGRGS
jgi:hypothetical protein